MYSKKIDVLLGLQWGDEGKGKLVDWFADQYDIVARFQGGANAGHTIVIDGITHILHLIPSGILREKICLIGKNVVIDPIQLLKEIEFLSLSTKVPILDLLKISAGAHLVLPTHRLLDKAKEVAKAEGKIGSTQRGIGPAYTDKVAREGVWIGLLDNIEIFHTRYQQLKEHHLNMLRQLPALEVSDFDLQAEEDAFWESIRRLMPYELVETSNWIYQQLKQKKSILAEGAQGTLLDIDWGTYPYVTSSNTTTAGVCTGLGVSPKEIGTVTGVVKAYTTRVGNGPFPTKIAGGIGDLLQKEGNEFGATTKRPRDCGWLDLPLLKYALRINGVDQVIITKTDILDHLIDGINVCTHYQLYDKFGSEPPRKIEVWDPALPLDRVEPVYRRYPGWSKPCTGVEDINELPVNLCQYLVDVFEKHLQTDIYAVTNGAGRDQIIRFHDPIRMEA